MNKRQVIQHAKDYLDQLARGVDPLGQREVNDTSPLAEPRLQKCFAFVSGVLGELLANDGFVAERKQSAVVQRTVLRPLERAAQVGIGETEVTDPRTGEIKTRLVLSEQAQRFLLDNLEAILAGAERGPE